MKAFLKKITLFLAGLTLVNILIYLFFAYPVLYKYYRVPLSTLTHYSRFLLGDSHARRFPQKYLDHYGIYNFSHGSDSYIDMFAKLNYLYNHGTPVDTVYITADDHTLSTYRETVNNKNRSIIYADKETYRRYYHHNRLLYYPAKYLRRYFPLFAVENSQLFVRYLAARLLPNRNPPENIHRSWTDYKDKESACRQRKADQFSAAGVSAQLSDCLIDIVNLCRQKGTTIIGVKFPLSGDYIRCIGDLNYGADSLLIKQNVALIDLKNAFADHDEYFFDQDHLNDTGVLKFLELLPDKIASVQRKNWSNGVRE